MQEVLQQLSNLQYIDSRIDEIRQLRGDLPEEVLDIETDIKRHEARISHREEEKKNLIGEKKDLELGIETAKQKNEKYEEQQLTVRNNREYDALTKEIEAQKQYAENATKRIEEIEKRLVELEDELEVNQKKLGDIQKLYEEKKENLDKVIESTESE
jgi:hypothetical protein